jgi:4-hydroxybenzoate polyprenyltransferase
MNLKSFLFALAIFSGGYLSNTLLDEAIDRAEKYFQIKAST